MVRACNPSYSGGRGMRIAWTQEAEVAVSQDDATVDSISKKQKKNKKQNKKKVCS